MKNWQARLTATHEERLKQMRSKGDSSSQEGLQPPSLPPALQASRLAHSRNVPTGVTQGMGQPAWGSCWGLPPRTDHAGETMGVG